jgi:hypothetical protein
MYLLLLGFLGAAALAGLSWWLFFRLPRAEQSYSFHCPSCGQKLRYLARKAGQLGKCPRCKQACTFPTGPQRAPANASEGGRVRFGRLPQHSAGKAPTT